MKKVGTALCRKGDLLKPCSRITQGGNGGLYMASWIIALILYGLIGYGVGGGLHPDTSPAPDLEGSDRKNARLFCIFWWPMELGFLIGTAVRYLQKKEE